MTIEQPSAAKGLIERAKNILMTPQAEWDRIATENTTLNALLVGYVLPLAIASALAGLLGTMFVYGFLAFAGGFSWVFGAVIHAALSVVIALLGVFLWGLLLNALAPTFASQPNPMRAHQLSAYSATAGLVGSIAMIVPVLGSLVAIAGAIYSVVLLYIGLPRLMKTPEEKRIPYVLTAAVIAIVIGFVMSFVLGSIALMSAGFGSRFGAVREPSRIESKISLPGGGTLDVEELERAAKEAQEAYEQGANVRTIAPAQLQALLPDALPGGFARTSISSSSAGAMMGGASQAEGVYQRGEARITLNVTQMGGMGGATSMLAAMGVQSNREDADGYSRMQVVDGRSVAEEVNRASGSAQYTVIGRNGVVISADGQGVTVEEARAAVNAVGVERAETLAASAE